MNSAKSSAAAKGEIEFKAIKQRFLALNRARLERTRMAMRHRQRDFLDLLPLLFHTNHAMLPGFVSKDTPAGVPGYVPDNDALQAAHRLSKSFQHSKQALRRHEVLAIYFMGSAGTIAYSDESDFDIWLCHEPELAPERVEKLLQKAKAIETWAAELDLEVHFFLIDAERFRRGEGERLSEESSGSAQHNLLLDEFYRTGLLLAGHYPLWWLVPPEAEGDYDEFVADLKRKRYLHARDHIDFGGLAHVPAEEFFGAALWQLYKGIDAPYKSVLKLSLIEAYANEYPRIELLSRRFKAAVYAGEEDLDRLDPYLMMLQKVEEYFDEAAERERLELTRRCFYFKLGKRLSEVDGRRQVNWQQLLLADVVKGWHWSRADLLVMDGREAWKVHRVTEERRILFDALSASYRFLSDFARRYAGLAMISQRDLNILGRKLYAAFERKAGKVELLNRGITSDLSESHLSLHQIAGGERHGSWVLFRGLVRPNDRSGETPVRRSRSVVELVAWCHFNRVLGPSTAIALYPRASILSMKEFRVLVDWLRTLFPADCLAARPMGDFARSARLLRGALFVNVGIDPFVSVTRQGDQIASNRTDPLRYGASFENLLVSLDQVLVTSWQEVLTHRYGGARAVVECLCEYLKWAPPSKGVPPQTMAVHGFSAGRGQSVAQRIEQLFADVSACYYDEPAGAASRYVLAVGTGYYVLQFDGDTPRYQHCDSYNALMRHLSRPQAQFSPIVIDRAALTDTVLPMICARNRPGYVQFFYRAVGNEADIYVLDERGSLFYHRMAFYDANALINQYSRFLQAVLNRMIVLMQERMPPGPAEVLAFFAIDRNQGGRLRPVRTRAHFGRVDRPYLSLQVIVEVEESQTVFTLYCGGREFSTLEYGSDLFNAVVRHVLELRVSGKHYPIYITDISMSRAVLGEDAVGKVQTVLFLQYKRRIEEQLNQVMQRQR